MASELGASQISTLLEALPGIANVLRSPVADALLNVISQVYGTVEMRRTVARPTSGSPLSASSNAAAVALNAISDRCAGFASK